MVTGIARRPRREVYVDGLFVQSLSARSATGFKAAVATGSVIVPKSAGPFQFGQRVQIFRGYSWPLTCVLDGEIPERGIAYWPNQIELTVVGALHKTQRPNGLVDDTIGDPEETETYAAEYSNITDELLIASLLELSGVDRQDIQGSGTVLGTIEPIRIPTSEAVWQRISRLDLAFGYRTFDGPDGMVTRRPIDGIPAEHAALTLVQAGGSDGIGRGARRRTSRQGAANVIIVRGLPPVSDIDIAVQSRVVGPADPLLIPTPPGEIADPAYDIPELETETLTEAAAMRILAQRNRPQEELSLPLVEGHEGVWPAQTVTLTAAALDLSSGGGGHKWWVEEAEHSDDGPRFSTNLSVRGAVAADGLNTNQRPVAVIVAGIGIRQRLADGTDRIVVPLDGSQSYDTDGTVAGWAWSGTGVTASLDPRYAVAVFAASTLGTSTATLTVTDDMGRTGTKTITLDGTTVRLAVIDFWVATGTSLEYTNDGGLTWTSFAVAAVVVPWQAADTYQLAATTAGTVYKVPADPAATPAAVLSGEGVTALWIGYIQGRQWTGICYAGTNNGEVWRSASEGAAGSWVLMGTLPGGGQINEISESIFAEGQLQALSGAAMWRSFDAGVTWTKVREHSNTALSATRMALGFDKGFFGLSGTPVGGEQPRVLERDLAVTLTFPSSGTPNITGLAMGYAAPVLYATDGAGNSYRVRADASGTWAARASVSAALTGPANYIVRSPFQGEVYVCGPKLGKTVDEFGTILVWRNVNALMGGYGAIRPVVTAIPATTLASLAAQDKAYNLWTGAANVAPPDGWQYATYDDSGWQTPVNLGVGTIPGAEALWSSTVPQSAGQQVVLRRAFTLPAGTIAAATLDVRGDDRAQEVWVNGTRLPGDTATSNLQTLTFDVAALLRTGPNLLAIRSANVIGTASGDASIQWRLVVS